MEGSPEIPHNSASPEMPHNSGPGYHISDPVDGNSYLVQAPTGDAASMMQRTAAELRGQLSAAEGLGEAIDSYKPDYVYLMNGNQKVTAGTPPHTHTPHTHPQTMHTCFPIALIPPHECLGLARHP